MSQSISKTAAPKRRKFTPAFYKKVAAFYEENGWRATEEKFRVSGTTILTAKRKMNGHAPAGERTGRGLYLAAKSLERALMAHRRAGSPPSDIEHYAFFLLKEILK